MVHVLCRNRLTDYTQWKRVFDFHAEAHRTAGLNLIHLWRNIDDPNTVFFLFEVSDMEKAKAFVNAPESAEAGKEAGVLDGEMYFLEGEECY